MTRKGRARLILAHLSLDERRGGNGESLNTAVDRTRDDSDRRRCAAHSWTTCSYAPDTCAQQRDLYDEPRYTVRKQRFWHVAGDFPRITEADLRPGVGDCCVPVSPPLALDQYLMTTDRCAAAVIRDGSPA